jgi:hypothetical protein
MRLPCHCHPCPRYISQPNPKTATIKYARQRIAYRKRSRSVRLLVIPSTIEVKAANKTQNSKWDTFSFGIGLPFLSAQHVSAHRQVSEAQFRTSLLVVFEKGNDHYAEKILQEMEDDGCHKASSGEIHECKEQAHRTNSN